MKKIIVGAILALSASIVILGGCYKPDESTSYYIEGENYRTIQISENVRHEEEYPIQSLSPYFDPNIVKDTIQIVVKYGYEKDSIFFRNANINIDGVKLIYDLLDMHEYPELNSEANSCLYTDLYTYSKQKTYKSTSIHEIEMPKPYNYCLVSVGSVDIYTIEYQDLSKSNGEVLNSGTFEAVVLRDDPISKFMVI